MMYFLSYGYYKGEKQQKWILCEVLAFRLRNSPLSGRGHDYVTSLNFGEIIDIISEVV